jgi:hypothetical protein
LGGRTDERIDWPAIPAEENGAGALRKLVLPNFFRPADAATNTLAARLRFDFM